MASLSEKKKYLKQLLDEIEEMEAAEKQLPPEKRWEEFVDLGAAFMRGVKVKDARHKKGLRFDFELGSPDEDWDGLFFDDISFAKFDCPCCQQLSEFIDGDTLYDEVLEMVRETPQFKLLDKQLNKIRSQLIRWEEKYGEHVWHRFTEEAWKRRHKTKKELIANEKTS